jgi:SAM-dependent methyltransferase
MTEVAFENTTIVDPDIIRNYFQPQAGNTERFIDVRPVRVREWFIPAREIIDNYEISEFGAGFTAVENLLVVVFERQFKSMPNDKIKIWQNTVLLRLECELRSLVTGQHFSDTKPESFADIDPEFDKREGADRKADILYYVDKLKNGGSVELPLYVSGNILNQRGAAADPKAMYMIDGARRLAAHALAYSEMISIYLLTTEEEFGEMVREDIKESFREKIKRIIWFNNYHSLPLLGITGQRSLRRYDLMDVTRLSRATVIDFGCNIGQASIKAVQAGACRVLGLDVMDDTLLIARDIKEALNIQNLAYQRVDFNDPDFDVQIDLLFPDMTDYSFFFSVYRTKELTQRERLFRYIIAKTKKGIFFEGHAHPKIDTIEYYEWLFDCFHLKYVLLGYSEEDIRPLFYLDVETTRAKGYIQ